MLDRCMLMVNQLYQTRVEPYLVLKFEVIWINNCYAKERIYGVNGNTLASPSEATVIKYTFTFTCIISSLRLDCIDQPIRFHTNMLLLTYNHDIC